MLTRFKKALSKANPIMRSQVNFRSEASLAV